MGKCFYCGNETTDTISFEGIEGIEKKQMVQYCCSNEHEEEIVKFNLFVNKNYKKFFTFMIILSLSVAITTPLAFFVNNLMLGGFIAVLPIFLIGLVIYKYPFATPQTNSKHGLKQAIKITKRIGIFFELVAVVAFLMVLVVGLFL